MKPKMSQTPTTAFLEVEEPVLSGSRRVSSRSWSCAGNALGRSEHTGFETCKLGAGVFRAIAMRCDWRQRAACFVRFCHCLDLVRCVDM